MKKHLLHIIPVACALWFAACDDFLTLESPDFTNEKFWRDSADVLIGLSSAYGQIDQRTDQYEFAEVKFVLETFREDIMAIGADVPNYPDWTEIYNFSYRNGNSRLRAYWMNNYNGINYTNNTLEGIRKIQASERPMSQATYETLYAEASFLRGYFHMKLLLNWEEIVIRDEYIVSEAQLHKALSTRVDAWEFIIAELRKAARLPQHRIPTEVGRATGAMAYAYLGWAYLTRAYEEPGRKEEHLNAALSALGNITDYELEADFLSMFDGTNKNSRESIFEIQFSPSTEGGAYHRHVMHKWVVAPILGGWDEIRPSAMIIAEFQKEGKISATGGYDQRAYDSMFFPDDYFNDGTGKVYGYDYDDVFGDGTSWFRKYAPSNLEELGWGAVATNIPIMRYANVMLMTAEAQNELGHPELAIPLINEIRDIHGKMPPMTGTTYEDVRAQIEHERLMEFALENVRFYDLRRWNILEEAMLAAGRLNFDSGKRFLPIPLTELQTNSSIN